MSSDHSASDATNTTPETTTPQGNRSWKTGAPTASDPAKTSPAAVFALVFGLIAFISGVTGVLAPLAILFGIVGVVLGVIGRKKGARPHLTGKSVATAGLVLAILALLLGIAVAVGAVTVLINPSLLDPVQQWFYNLVGQLPGGG